MKRHTTITITGITVLATLAACFWAAAAPIMPVRGGLPDEAYSLAGMRRINAFVDAVPTEVRDAADKIEQVFFARLEDAGLEIAEAPEEKTLPKVVLQIQAATDTDQPDSLALGLVIAVHQPVTVERLDARLMVPTVSTSNVLLTTRDKASEVLEAEVKKLTTYVTKVIRVASKNQRIDTSRQ